jgi:hypothetical protein
MFACAVFFSLFLLLVILIYADMEESAARIQDLHEAEKVETIAPT